MQGMRLQKSADPDGRALRNHCSSEIREWYSCTSPDRDEEDDLRKGIVLAIGGLALLVGCGKQADKASNVPATPKWQGAPYHIAAGALAAKPNPAGITIPAIKYTANPDALEKRVSLVVRFDTSGATKQGALMNRMIMAPVDISGAEGTLPASYMDVADKDLSRFVGAYGMKGKIKIFVALASSSLSSQAEDAEVDAKRLSDWLPIEVVFKSAHPTR
jgi:hypothetical protein